MRKLIMASQSPRRREILEQVGFDFSVIPSDVEEKPGGTLPDEVVIELSLQKAMDVYQKNNDNVVVIGADTVVSVDNKIMGKPADRDEAFLMLKTLQGRTHQVYTGVSLVWDHEDNGDKFGQFSFCECTYVTFFSMTDREIREYISTGECDDKAGSYAIQGICAKYISKIDGDYNNVVGLPVARLYQEMKKRGLI